MEEKGGVWVRGNAFSRSFVPFGLSFACPDQLLSRLRVCARWVTLGFIHGRGIHRACGTSLNSEGGRGRRAETRRVDEVETQERQRTEVGLKLPFSSPLIQSTETDEIALEKNIREAAEVRNQLEVSNFPLTSTLPSPSLPMLPSSSSDPQSDDDPEDVFSFFVQSLDEKPFAFTPNEVCYGDIRVTTAEKGESSHFSARPPSFVFCF